MKAALLTLGVVLAGSASWEPYILHVDFEDGTQVEWAAANSHVCQQAIRALYEGRLSVEKPLAGAVCRPGNLFGPDVMRGIK